MSRSQFNGAPVSDAVEGVRMTAQPYTGKKGVFTAAVQGKVNEGYELGGSHEFNPDQGDALTPSCMGGE